MFRNCFSGESVPDLDCLVNTSLHESQEPDFGLPSEATTVQETKSLL